jgi:hypothetical protein
MATTFSLESRYVEAHDNAVIEMGASINSRAVVGQGARITGSAFLSAVFPTALRLWGCPRAGCVIRNSALPPAACTGGKALSGQV